MVKILLDWPLSLNEKLAEKHVNVGGIPVRDQTVMCLLQHVQMFACDEALTLSQLNGNLENNQPE